MQICIRYAGDFGYVSCYLSRMLAGESFVVNDGCGQTFVSMRNNFCQA